MISLNKVFLVGNLTRDPELRYTPQGTAVLTLRLAVNTPFKDKNGEAKRDTCFINVVAWSQLAEICNQYLSKGRAILVEGRLISRSWQDQDGKQRNIIEVRAERVQFLPQNRSNETEVEKAEIDLGDEPEEVIKLDDELGEVS